MAVGISQAIFELLKTSGLAERALVFAELFAKCAAFALRF